MDTTHLLVTDLEVDSALADPAVPDAFRAVWQLLWESEVTLEEVLALDVPDAELLDRVVGFVHENGLWLNFWTLLAIDLLRRELASRRRRSTVCMSSVLPWGWPPSPP